jgi:hypothetical protein
MFLAVVENMERSTVVSVEAVPCGHPDNIVCIFKNIIDGTVGKSVPVIQVLQEILICGLCIRCKGA